MDMVLRGTGQADTLEGGDGFDTLRGLGGGDLLEGGEAFDLIDGGAGNDTLNVGSGRFVPSEFQDLIDTAPNSPDALRIRNSAEVVDLIGTLQGNLLIRGNVALGGGGSDLIVGSAFFDTLVGGGGNDTIRGVNGRNLLVGGNGNDSIIGGLVRDEIVGGPGNDTIAGRIGSDRIGGGSGSDSISGGFGGDSISGGIGGDIIAGGFNRDSLFGDAGNDDISGGNGNDGLNGGAGSDTLDGGTNRDTLIGDVGNDLLIGGRDNDFLVGGAGRDTLRGGEGRDVLIGDASDSPRGIDTFVLDGSPFSTIGADRITDFQRAETIQISRSAFNIRGRADFEIVDVFSREITIFQPNQDDNQQPSARFFYERATGGIYRNIDGRLTGGGGEVLVAQVEGFTNLENSHFQFIA